MEIAGGFASFEEVFPKREGRRVLGVFAITPPGDRGALEVFCL
jgi:hypothetical protein